VSGRWAAPHGQGPVGPLVIQLRRADQLLVELHVPPSEVLTELRYHTLAPDTALTAAAHADAEAAPVQARPAAAHADAEAAARAELESF
jgi:hypothetical protein